MNETILSLPNQSGNHSLRIRFWFLEDRFRHAIELVSDAGTETVLSSLEGTPQDDFPPSPPLQEIHSQELAPEKPVILGVGMAGKGHWSASFSIESDNSATPVFQFDLACLLAADQREFFQLDQLGSTYQVANGWKLTSDAQNQNRWLLTRVNSDHGDISIDLSDSVAVLHPGEGNSSDSFMVSPESLSANAKTSTRWVFTLGLVSVS